MSLRIIRRQAAAEPSPLWPENLHPLLRRVYAHRGLSSLEELERGLKHMLPFDRLKGIEVAVERLFFHLQNQSSILIIGDFDADGATSTALAVSALRMLGARRVNFLVPNRFRFGYGLTPEIVAETRVHQPDLLITVDNGISSIEGVVAAQAAGMEVIVTDHHLAGDTLPAAEAIVNPNQPGCPFPSKALAGVGVIFYVMLALRAACRERGWFDTQGLAEPNMASLLDLVALGTVADVVPLDHNNRILVEQGLRRIRAGQARPGILAMIEVAKRNPRNLVAADLGFALGPRLNAAGRLEDMSIGINCLLCEDGATARGLAAQLDELNRERREIEGEMQAQALDDLRKLDLHESGDMPFGLCLYQEDWHQGVIGILASRIKDRFHRPVIAFADADNGEIKGSARSVSGVHIRDVLDAIATHHPGLLSKFGGHAMAAGMSLPKSNLAQFAAAFDEEVRQHLDRNDLQGSVYSDGELDNADFSMEVAQVLRDGGPWGQAFPEPRFDGHFRVVSQRIVGEKHLKMSLQAPGMARALDAIAFNVLQSPRDPLPVSEGQMSHAVFKLDINEFRGQRSLQLMIEHIDGASET